MEFSTALSLTHIDEGAIIADIDSKFHSTKRRRDLTVVLSNLCHFCAKLALEVAGIGVQLWRAFRATLVSCKWQSIVESEGGNIGSMTAHQSLWRRFQSEADLLQRKDRSVSSSISLLRPNGLGSIWALNRRASASSCAQRVSADAVA